MLESKSRFSVFPHLLLATYYMWLIVHMSVYPAQPAKIIEASVDLEEIILIGKYMSQTTYNTRQKGNAMSKAYVEETQSQRFRSISTQNWFLFIK